MTGSQSEDERLTTSALVTELVERGWKLDRTYGNDPLHYCLELKGPDQAFHFENVGAALAALDDEDTE